jgi:hypothetical protein
MSMNKFRNNVLSLAGLQFSNFGFATTGIVTQINPENSSLVRVQISEAFNDQPALVTGWIPVASPWSGDGFGFFAPPSYNDLVLLIFAEGDMQSPIAGVRIFNDEDRALNVPSGELWLVHKSGSFIKLTNDGKLGLNGNVEIDLASVTINIAATAQCKINAPSVNIGVASDPFFTLMMSNFIAFFNSHIHTTPDGDSGPPITPADSTYATTATEAN